MTKINNENIIMTSIFLLLVMILFPFIYVAISNGNIVWVVVVFILLCVLAGVLFVLHHLQKKKMDDAFEKIELAKIETNRQLEILHAMADVYYSMHIINIEEDSLLEYEAKNQVLDITSKNKKGSATDIMHQVMYATMSDEYLEAGLNFSEVSTLPERLRNKKIISMDLLGCNVGWIRMSFITIEADGEGVPLRVICTTQIIDEEKKKEEELLRESNTDELTGCSNRRAYEDDLLHYPSIPTEDNYVYIAMDINGLKETNDTKGHEAGDELLLGAVECMKQCIGNYGKIYRVGGDEFVAMIFAEEEKLKHIMEDFEETQLTWRGKYIDSVAVSYGIATKREFPTSTVIEMARIADLRMYEQKARYYKESGIDRRGQSMAFTALCSLYTKILRINVTEDYFNVITMDENERTEALGYSNRISEWLVRFGDSGQVFEADLCEYKRKTELEYLRNYFHSGKSELSINYRRKIDNQFKEVVMEIIPADDYTEENQSLFLYVKALEK